MTILRQAGKTVLVTLTVVSLFFIPVLAMAQTPTTLTPTERAEKIAEISAQIELLKGQLVVALQAKLDTLKGELVVALRNKVEELQDQLVIALRAKVAELEARIKLLRNS